MFLTSRYVYVNYDYRKHLMKLGGIVYIGTHVWFELDNYSYLIIHILIKNL